MTFKIRKANKIWQCQICSKIIQKGERHYEILLRDYNSRPNDNLQVSNTRICNSCGLLREELL